MPNLLEHLRFSYETELFYKISKRHVHFPCLDETESRYLLDARRRDLLGNSVRVTNDLLPEIHNLYQSCLNTIGGGLNGDLFVKQSSEYNANVFAHGNNFDVLINSALIKDFSKFELSFVFGHELGHVVFGHNRFPVHDILRQSQSIDSNIANILFCWSRATEISADRLGLLCCGQMAPSVTALFKISSGLAGIDFDRVLNSFRKQYKALEDHLKKVSDLQNWIHTHPMIPIRFKALELAALDIVSLKHKFSGFSEKGFIEIDRQIASLLRKLEMKFRY